MRAVSHKEEHRALEGSSVKARQRRKPPADSQAAYYNAAIKATVAFANLPSVSGEENELGVLRAFEGVAPVLREVSYDDYDDGVTNMTWGPSQGVYRAAHERVRGWLAELADLNAQRAKRGARVPAALISERLASLKEDIEYMRAHQGDVTTPRHALDACLVGLNRLLTDFPQRLRRCGAPECGLFHFTAHGDIRTHCNPAHRKQADAAQKAKTRQERRPRAA